MLRFAFDETKALEALTLVAQRWDGVSAFYAAKIFFIAERDHLTRFGRPIVGDRYIAMDHGPVPSIIYDWLKARFDTAGDPASISAALNVRRENGVYKASARRAPNFDYLSQSDVEALEWAIDYCRRKTFGALSAETHRDPAYQAASLNSEMDPTLMIQGEGADVKRQSAEEFAAYGVG